MARLPDVLPVLRPKRARLPDCRMARLPDFTQKAVRFHGKEQIKDRDIVPVSLMSFQNFTSISMENQKKSRSSHRLFDEFPKFYYYFRVKNR